MFALQSTRNLISHCSQGSFLRQVPAAISLPKRGLWQMLNVIFNKPDKDRIKEVGPDRACAEWLLKCGAHVRWVDSDSFHTDYNSLPTGSFSRFKIEEVNAENAGVMSIGFVHFEGCKHIKKMRFHYCANFEDACLRELSHVRESLEDLTITSCGNVSDKGLDYLADLSLLKVLLLRDMPAVRDKKGSLARLQKALPDCDITFGDLTDKKEGKS